MTESRELTNYCQESVSPSHSRRYAEALNNIDFSNVGNSITKDTSAFKKIQNVSKLSNNHVNLDTNANNSLFRKVSNLYIN